jgi:hypothetical protein
VGFVVDKAALGQVFSEYSASPANHSTNFSIIIIIRGWHNRPIGGCSAKWTKLDSTPHYTNLKKNCIWYHASPFYLQYFYSMLNVRIISSNQDKENVLCITSRGK